MNAEILTYSSNLEDVIIQRVFQDQKIGYYVDVGAGHPIRNSNTYALYQKGWRGIAIDPLGVAQNEWARHRPEDIFFCSAVGERSGEIPFWVFLDAHEISTCSELNFQRWSQHGAKPEVRTVSVLTLNQILGPDEIHLMSIDVEGMEKEVLHGLDFHRYRPWLLVIEAVIPGSPDPAWDEWEDFVLGQDYSMVYWDGLNRFYLANEHNDLAFRFATPPCVWDHYIHG